MERVLAQNANGDLMSTGSDNDRETTDSSALVMQRLLNDLLAQQQALTNDLLTERRRDRRQKNLRLGLIAASCLLVLVSYIYLIDITALNAIGDAPSGPYGAIVQIKGEIADGEPSNAVAIGRALERAFKDPRARGVVLYINSAGGSPVQSAIIHDRILSLKSEYPDKPVIAVATDIVASGAYFVASAADRIYVNHSTITGSIGVMSAGFGFPDVLQRLGIERRIFTSGDSKAQLDPFSPLTDEDAAEINRILGGIHEHFVEAVTEARADRLTLDTVGLFEGDVWTGAEAVEIGLVDSLGDLTTVLQRELGVEHTRDYTVKPTLLDRVTRLAARTAVSELAGRHQLRIR